MSVTDLLTFIGLSLDMIGAVLLIGQDWRVTRRFAYAVNPDLRRLNNAISAIWLSLRSIGPGDDGFEELAELVIDEGLFRLSEDEIRCEWIEAPTTPLGLAEFKLTRANPAKQTSNQKVSRKTVRKLQTDHLQQWFVRCGVRFLIAGFFLQIVATVAPYLLCLALVLLVWSVPFPVPVPLPLPVSGVCAV